MRLADLMGLKSCECLLRCANVTALLWLRRTHCNGIPRFIRAVKWASAQASIKRIEATLRWRREFGVYDLITASHVEPEVSTHVLVYMDVV